MNPQRADWAPDQSGSLVYLGAVIKEAMRLWPVAALLSGIIQTFAVAMDHSMVSVAQQLGLQLSDGLRNNSVLKLTLSQVAPILPYLFLVLILIFRPKGLLGTREG